MYTVKYININSSQRSNNVHLSHLKLMHGVFELLTPPPYHLYFLHRWTCKNIQVAETKRALSIPRPLQGQLKLNYCTSSLHISNRCLPTNSYIVIVFNLKMPCYLTSQMCFSQWQSSPGFPLSWWHTCPEHLKEERKSDEEKTCS